MKVVYLAVIGKDRSPGVMNKINGFVDSVKSDSMEIVAKFIEHSPYLISDIKNSINSIDSGIIILRSISYQNFLLIKTFIEARKRGVRIFIDVPSPNKTVLKEIYLTNNSLFIRLKAMLYLIITGPIPYYFVDRVFQYSREGFWFKVGNSKRTYLIGNGIDTNSVNFIASKPKFDGLTLRLISVSTIKEWHGIDRIIQAVKYFNSDLGGGRKVILDIVGEGPLLVSLKQKAQRCGLSKEIQFHGAVHGKELINLYNNCHVGVGSLGLHRIGLKVTSTLKLREYCAMGLPFIYSGSDPDFNKSLPFVFHVDQGEEIESIVKAFESIFEKFEQINRTEIRLYASEHLDFKIKYKKMLLD